MKKLKGLLKSSIFKTLVIGYFLTAFSLGAVSAQKELFLKPSSFSEEDLEKIDENKILGVNTSSVTSGGFGPLLEKKYPDLSISAKSALAINLSTGEELFAFNKDLTLPPASTTKIVTALVVLENYDLSKKALIPSDCVGIEGTNVGFVAGDVVTIEQLLYGMLVKSAADAACALAEVETNKPFFIEKMNKKAEELGLIHTKFKNEIGLDEDGEDQVSTAYDLSVLGREALKNDNFRKIVGTRSIDIVSIGSKETYHIENTNELLFTLPGTTGVKTGYTDKALGCLVFSYENLGKKILVVVMGSEDRFGDTKKILDFSLIEAGSQALERGRQ